MPLFGSERDAKIATQELQDRCRALEHRCEDLERGAKALGLEWEELYDKVRRMMSRISKRVAVDQREAQDVSEEIATETAGTGVDSVSARILARRTGHGG